ncbi:MAG: V-type ATP synthase subunit E [Candidatus Heimdallarchaeaceae archaeon]
MINIPTSEEKPININNEALTRLLEKIQKEAEDAVKKIQIEAKAKLEEIEKGTKKLVEEVKKKELDKEVSRIDFLRKRTETEFQQEAKKIKIQAKEKLIDDVFEKVESTVSDFRKNKKYTSYLEKTLAKSIKNMRVNQVKIIIDKKDVTIFKKIIENISKKDKVECVLESSLKTEGGFILTDSKERVRINHTLENLLDASREKIRTKINELLFV